MEVLIMCEERDKILKSFNLNEKFIKLFMASGKEHTWH